MHIILKLLLLRERLFCLLFLFGMTVLAASCQLPEREVSVRRTTTLRAADTVQSPSLKGLIYCYYGRQDLNRGTLRMHCIISRKQPGCSNRSF